MRQSLRVILGVFVSLWFLPLFSCADSAPIGKTLNPAEEPQSTWKSLGDNLYAVIARAGGTAGSNSGVVVLPGEVIVFDAHFKVDAADALSRELARHFNRPVKWLVLSHYHSDHVGGRDALGGSAEVVVHPSVDARLSIGAERARRGCGGSVCLPLRAVKDRLALVLDGRTFEILHPGRGHTDGDLVLWLPKERVLFAGDLFVENHIGFWGDGYPREWVKTLERLIELRPRIVVPGHGVPTDLAGLEAFRSFMLLLIDTVDRGVSAGKTADQILAGLNLPEPYSFWRGQQMFLEKNVRRIISERATPH